MKRIPILLILLVFAISGCSKDRNPLEDEPDPGIPKLNTPEVEYNLGQGEVVLSWERRENAEKYIVCKKLETDDEYKPIGTPSATEFRDTDVEHNATYQYIVAAITAGGLEGNDSDPVIIKVPEPPELIASPSPLDFRESHRELKLDVQNTGGRGLKWQISSQERWLAFNPEQGEILARGTEEISVRVDRELLEWGERREKVSIESDDSSYEIEIVVVKAGVFGTVMDSRTDAPIDGAQVSVNGDTQTVKSDGEFAFTIQKYGEFTLSASRDGYIPTEVDAEVTAGKFEPVQLQLGPIPRSTGDIQGDFNEPTYIAFSRDGDRAYITNNRGNSVTVINAFNDNVVDVIPVEDRPIGIAANPVRDEVYVANNWSHSVSVIETKSGKKVADINDVGRFPTNLVVSPDGNWLYSVNSRGNDVSVIDINQRQVRDNILVGEEPHSITITPDGAYLYVTNNKADTVSVVDTKSLRQIGKIGVGQDPTDITVSPDGQRIYVSAGFTDGRLMVIDATANELVGEHPTGADPRGLVVIEDVVYVVARGENKVELFDAARGVVVEETIKVGMRPIGIATNGEKIYVANAINSTVSVLEFP